jgi:hypothetical protein
LYTDRHYGKAFEPDRKLLLIFLTEHIMDFIHEKIVTGAHLQAAYNFLLSRINADGGGDIKSDGTVAFTGNQSMGNNKLTGLADATAATDAVNLQTVQAQGYGTGDIKADGTVAFTGTQSFGAGMAVTAGDMTLSGAFSIGADPGISPFVRIADGAANKTEIGDIGATGSGTLLTVDDVARTIDHVALHHKFDLQDFLDDATAGIAGLTTGDLYHTAGVVMVKL